MSEYFKLTKSIFCRPIGVINTLLTVAIINNFIILCLYLSGVTFLPLSEIPFLVTAFMASPWIVLTIDLVMLITESKSKNRSVAMLGVTPSLIKRIEAMEPKKEKDEEERKQYAGIFAHSDMLTPAIIEKVKTKFPELFTAGKEFCEQHKCSFNESQIAMSILMYLQKNKKISRMPKADLDVFMEHNKKTAELIKERESREESHDNIK